MYQNDMMWSWWLWGIGWWVLLSALLFFCWNKVVCEVSNLRPMRFWHVLLVVTTIAAVCEHHYLSKKYAYFQEHRAYGTHSMWDRGDSPHWCGHVRNMNLMQPTAQASMRQ